MYKYKVISHGEVSGNQALSYLLFNKKFIKEVQALEFLVKILVNK